MKSVYQLLIAAPIGIFTYIVGKCLIRCCMHRIMSHNQVEPNDSILSTHPINPETKRLVDPVNNQLEEKKTTINIKTSKNNDGIVKLTPKGSNANVPSGELSSQSTFDSEELFDSKEEGKMYEKSTTSGQETSTLENNISSNPKRFESTPGQDGNSRRHTLAPNFDKSTEQT